MARLHNVGDLVNNKVDIRIYGGLGRRHVIPRGSLGLVLERNSCIASGFNVAMECAQWDARLLATRRIRGRHLPMKGPTVSREMLKKIEDEHRYHEYVVLFSVAGGEPVKHLIHEAMITGVASCCEV